MDCEKLKADIQSLRDAQAAFEDAVDAANETGLGNTKCKEALGQASKLEDAIACLYVVILSFSSISRNHLGP
mgnify:CR=1 FL=1